MWNPAAPLQSRVRHSPWVRPWCLHLVIALLAVTAIGCQSQMAEESKPQKPAMETVVADVMTLSMQPWPTIVRSQGSLNADEESVVAPKVAGRVAKVHVDLGDFVKTGDPLVSLDQEEFQLQVAQAEAQLEQTRSAVGLHEGEGVENLVPENAPPVREQKALWEEAQNVLERAARLLSQNAIADGEYDQVAAAERVAEARYASSINSVREKIALIGVRQAELSLARQRLQDAVIVAPLDGYVQQRQVAPGSYLSVGQAIAVVVRDHPLRFRGTVPERHAQALAVGQQVRLKIESVGQPRQAVISRVSPTLDQQSRSLMFEAEVDNRDHLLRTGLFAEAEVVTDASAKALVIPESALVEFAGTQKVWKVVDGVAGEQEVLTGTRRDGAREVLEGLAVGDTLLREAAKGRIAKIQSPATPELAAPSDTQSDDGSTAVQNRAGREEPSRDATHSKSESSS